jgi:hypothetical protein
MTKKLKKHPPRKPAKGHDLSDDGADSIKKELDKAKLWTKPPAQIDKVKTQTEKLT